MPSPEHEILIELLRAAPLLVARLLEWSKVDLGEVHSVAIVDSTFAAVTLHPDLAVLLETERLGKVCAVPEIQLRIDDDKKRSWPAYETLAAREHECVACVIVITLDERVASWASERVPFGLINYWSPIVIGPGRLHAIVDAAEARGDPHLAVLSARLHARTRDALPTARAALAALDLVRDDLAAVCFELIYKSLDEIARAALEREMALENYVPTNKWYRQAIEEGLAKGRDEGLAKGRDEGRVEGEARGAVMGERDALRAVIAARRLAATAEQLARIESCANVETLRSWIVRAATATSIDEVFA